MPIVSKQPSSTESEDETTTAPPSPTDFENQLGLVEYLEANQHIPHPFRKYMLGSLYVEPPTKALVSEPSWESGKSHTRISDLILSVAQ